MKQIPTLINVAEDKDTFVVTGYLLGGAFARSISKQDFWLDEIFGKGLHIQESDDGHEEYTMEEFYEKNEMLIKPLLKKWVQSQLN